MSKQFKVGDKVTWRSQAAGSYTNKKGEIIEVIPAGQRPKIPGCGYARKHESYVVKAEAESTGRTRKYWPIVTLLQPVEETAFDTETEPYNRTYTVKAEEGEDLRNLSPEQLVERGNTEPPPSAYETKTPWPDDHKF